MNEKKIDLSVIIPVSERYDDVESMYQNYKNALSSLDKSFEIIYVLDGQFPDVLNQLTNLQSNGERLTIIQLAKWFGEATALTSGFENSSGEVLLTLPAYSQIEPEEIPKVLDALHDSDMAIARRWPRLDSKINQLQSKIFHGTLNLITGSSFRDLGCGVRAFKRQVVNEIPVYGDQHRFFPLLASRRGFNVVEVDVKQSQQDQNLRIYNLGIYPRRMLDILAVFFLVKFTKKPLRFFGLVGMGTFAVGGILLLYLIVERLFFGVALADRPALLLSSLLVVLGVQVFAIGLIGELIIFTHAKAMKEYTVDKIIN
jgi:glycosyltransferase involved in cell wall biosynthesis